jgi:hypothetical protein
MEDFFGVPVHTNNIVNSLNLMTYRIAGTTPKPLFTRRVRVGKAPARQHGQEQQAGFPVSGNPFKLLYYKSICK